MALFDTYRLLTKFKKNGYVIREVEDSTGRTCWDVFWRDIGHNFQNNQNIVNETYIGKVEKYGITDWAPFGKPYFYHTWVPEMQNRDVFQKANSIARRNPRTKVFNQIDPATFNRG